MINITSASFAFSTLDLLVPNKTDIKDYITIKEQLEQLLQETRLRRAKHLEYMTSHHISVKGSMYPLTLTLIIGLKNSPVNSV